MKLHLGSGHSESRLFSDPRVPRIIKDAMCNKPTTEGNYMKLLHTIGFDNCPISINTDNIICIHPSKDPNCVTVFTIGNTSFVIRETHDSIIKKLEAL